jgi:hypothetical protein
MSSYHSLLELYKLGLVSSDAALEHLTKEVDTSFKAERTAVPDLTVGNFTSSDKALERCTFCGAGAKDVKVTTSGEVRCLKCGKCYMYITDMAGPFPDPILENHQTCDGCLDLFPNSALNSFPQEGSALSYCNECSVEVNCGHLADSIEDSLEDE